MAGPGARPVLVTGAGGFVGGHVARAVAAAGWPVRGLSRRGPAVELGDPPIEWVAGDLRRGEDRRRAVDGCGAVVHVAGWVSLGRDRRGDAVAVNVEATRGLLAESRDAGVDRFVATSTLWAVAAGSAEAPATEDSAWNLGAIRSPYSETKRAAERLVRDASGPGFRTAVLCPGLVVGPRDVGPTSTRLLLSMARLRLAALPPGGIPIVDASVLATAHLRALEGRAEPGARYAVVGPYLGYREMAAIVRALTGRPGRVIPLPAAAEGPLIRLARLADRLGLGRSGDFSPAAIAGGFLRLHVSGARADAAFGLVHPPAVDSIRAALVDHRRSGRAPGLRIDGPRDP